MMILPYEHETGKLVWNEIIVFDSLQEQPGKELVYSKLQWVSQKAGYGVRYADVPDAETLFKELREVLKYVSEGSIPILHFEMHGGSKGLMLASGEVVSWVVLGNFFRLINIDTDNRLIIVLAACHGVELSSQVFPLLKAPFRLAIAPAGEVSFGVLEEGFDTFYDKIHESVPEAISALNNHSNGGPFRYLDPTELFYQVWEEWRAQFNSPEKVNELFDLVLKNELISGPDGFNEEKVRNEWIRILSGEIDMRWLIYRHFMMAEKTPDTGEDSFYII